MLYKVFDFAEKEVAGRDGPAARRRRRSRSTCRPRRRWRRARPAVHALPGLPRVARRDRRDPPCARPRGLAPRRRLATVAARDLLRPPYVVPETKDLGALLADFRRTNQHMAVVVDEYGATAGIVTLEDLLEEIVGDIEDEFDLPNESVERVSETTIRIDGSSRSTTSTRSSGRRSTARTSTPSPGSCSAISAAPRSSGTRSSTTGCASACSRRAARGSSASRSSSCPRASRRYDDRRREAAADAARSASSPLRHRDFALYVGATVATAFAIEMSFVAIGWQVYEIHRDPLDLGIVGLAMFLPLPLLALPAGHLADRYPRRTILALAIGARRRGRGRPAARDALRAPTRPGRSSRSRSAPGVASALGAPAGRALTPSLVPQEILVKAFAQRSVAFQLSVIGGPALGGLLFAIHPELVYARVRRRSRSLALAAVLAMRAGPRRRRRGLARPRERARRRAARPADAGAPRRDLARPLRRPLRRRGRAAAGVREGRARGRPGRPRRAPRGARRRRARRAARSCRAGRSAGARAGRSSPSSRSTGVDDDRLRALGDDVALARSRSRSAAASTW